MIHDDISTYFDIINSRKSSNENILQFEQRQFPLQQGFVQWDVTSSDIG